ncbi:MarR family transcriptional regulator [Halarchaeum nitratireducens]|uniref:HTH marR-type domain-containing protein n=1 Tax=Halarchaeum nitratireducens TaxID=489913 RepID=A0A830GEN9_9EURY|nr:helix-turn-helix domain-containing protein [Halarchaeum nitratireducens]GGN27041.1 hypothetical protein GCM10009021_31980 [Halarchaeum nitratireducens]
MATNDAHDDFTIPDVVRDASTSTTLTYAILYRQGGATRSTIREKTGLSDSSITRALEQLTTHGVVSARYDPRDARRKIYELEVRE